MNLISIILGSIGLLIALVGLLPLLGWLNWVALVISMFGIVFGIFAVKKEGRNLSAVVFVLAIFRLMIGGGII
ncbi:MAG: hypothetical protein ACOCYF_00940 [Bacteroidota bacterium]